MLQKEDRAGQWRTQAVITRNNRWAPSDDLSVHDRSGEAPWVERVAAAIKQAKSVDENHAATARHELQAPKIRFGTDG